MFRGCRHHCCQDDNHSCVSEILESGVACCSPILGPSPKGTYGGWSSESVRSAKGVPRRKGWGREEGMLRDEGGDVGRGWRRGRRRKRGRGRRRRVGEGDLVHAVDEDGEQSARECGPLVCPWTVATRADPHPFSSSSFQRWCRVWGYRARASTQKPLPPSRK